MVYLIFATVKLTALGFAGVYSVRASFWPGAACVAAVVYFTIAALLTVFWVELPGAEVVTSSWWVLPGSAFATSLASWILASRRTARERHGSTSHEQYRRAMYAFLANTILDGCLLAVFAIAHALASQSPL